MKCDYEAFEVDGVLCVTDLDLGGASVTNAIEGVLSNLALDGFNMALPIIYRDSAGLWDGVLHTETVFLGFYPIGLEDEAGAIRIAKARAS